ncbi:site-specific integrase [Trichococcus ilyis]|uniref:AP2-like DNA-binding integrase domain-containing protein n=1 Tax=Trichococcus ilyis TaxID=640938 RepID=A0A143YX32_9LACT|nr:site-specific integrase [Trichococcus ilyis]CZQ99839.1 integrase catalytic [Trichococcus ilyis]SEJ72199.1 AP2-like DNA-binding integrase domain-containing protein [Trichococcus ilyis]
MTKIKVYLEKKTGRTTYWFSHYNGIDPTTGKRDIITRRGFDTEADAEFELAKLKLELSKGTYSKKTTVTFLEVFEEWKIGYQNTVRPVTLDRTMQQFEKYVLPAFGAKPIDSISLGYCQQVVNDWSTHYTNFKVLKSCVQRVLDHAVRLKYTSDSPMRYVQMPRKNVSKAELLGEVAHNFYDTNELQTFFDTLTKNFGLKEVALFRVLAFAGLRKGEAIALNWSDIDFEQKTLSVKRNMTYLNGKQELSEAKTKKSVRTLSLDDGTVSILKKWKNFQAQELLQLGINHSKSTQPVFNRFSKYGFNEPLYMKYPDTVVEKVLNLNPQLKKISIHGFRHTHASILIEGGANMKEVQERLGHSNIQTTMDIYGHMTQKARENTAEKFAKQVNF